MPRLWFKHSSAEPDAQGAAAGRTAPAADRNTR